MEGLIALVTLLLNDVKSLVMPKPTNGADLGKLTGIASGANTRGVRDRP